VSRGINSVTRIARKRLLPTREVDNYSMPLNVTRGAVLVYARRVHIPWDLQNLGTLYGYWRIVPASIRAQFEVSITAAGVDLVTAGSTISSSAAGFRWPDVYECTVRRLLRSAVEDNIYALEIVNVDSSKNLVFYKVTAVAQPLAILGRRPVQDEQVELQPDTQRVA
jgi:hypothetical protein